MIVNKNCFLQTNWFGEILLQFWSHPVETNQSCAVYWYFVKRLLKNMINFQSLLILYSYISVHIRTKATFTRGKGARQLGNKKLALINGNVSAIFVLISLFWSFFLLWCQKSEWQKNYWLEPIKKPDFFESLTGEWNQLRLWFYFLRLLEYFADRKRKFGTLNFNWVLINFFYHRSTVSKDERKWNYYRQVLPWIQGE